MSGQHEPECPVMQIGCNSVGGYDTYHDRGRVGNCRCGQPCHCKSIRAALARQAASQPADVEAVVEALEDCKRFGMRNGVLVLKEGGPYIYAADAVYKVRALLNSQGPREADSNYQAGVEAALGEITGYRLGDVFDGEQNLSEYGRNSLVVECLICGALRLDDETVPPSAAQVGDTETVLDEAAVATAIRTLAAAGDAEWKVHNATCVQHDECQWDLPPAVTSYSRDGVTYTVMIDVDEVAPKLAALLRSQPVVLTLEELEALPLDSIVMDRAGQPGIRDHLGWFFTHAFESTSEGVIERRGPVRLLYRAGDGQ